MRVCVIAHVRDGKMDRAREYFDSGSLARQRGLDSATVAAMYASLGAADLATTRRVLTTMSERAAVLLRPSDA